MVQSRYEPKYSSSTQHFATSPFQGCEFQLCCVQRRRRRRCERVCVCVCNTNAAAAATLSLSKLLYQRPTFEISFLLHQTLYKSRLTFRPLFCSLTCAHRSFIIRTTHILSRCALRLLLCCVCVVVALGAYVHACSVYMQLLIVHRAQPIAAGRSLTTVNWLQSVSTVSQLKK